MPINRPPSSLSLLSSEALDRSRVLDTLVNNLQGMAYRCHTDQQWKMIFVSRGATELCGYPPEELVGVAQISWDSITHPEDRPLVRESINAAIKLNQRFAVRYRITTRSGETRWVLERGIPVHDENHEIVVEGFIEDITTQQAVLTALEQAEQRYRSIFEHACEGIFQTTRDGRYLAANPALAALYGYASATELITDLSDIDRRLYATSGRRAEFLRLMERDDQVINFESEVYRKDGSRIWISENVHVVRGPVGEFLCYEGTVQNISERRHHQQQLEYQANHDLLTGLPNRTMLTERIERGISRADRMGYYLALVFIDLDNFKFINDSLGHSAGDELLKQIARRLSACLRKTDTVTRLGGDEFVLVLNDHYQASSVVTLLNRVLAEIGKPVALSGRTYQIGASLGVALYPQDGQDAQSLLKHADVAMYAAKSRGRNNIHFFTRELNRQANQRLSLEAAMRIDIERDQFEVHYQPKVDCHRRILGVEALARWFHPELGTIGPDRFIPIAEDAGLILPLTTLILRRAFAAARRWNHERQTPLCLAVNLSPHLFLNESIVTHIASLLLEAGLSASLVELEITENVFLFDSERAVSILQAFKAQGFQLAMDDFGTGYSSLSYLRRFALDIIKIDRSLVTGIEHGGDGAMIVGAVISLGQSLLKTVVAEGVENQEQFQLLTDMGCDEFQGYLLSRPLPESDISRLLHAQRAPVEAELLD